MQRLTNDMLRPLRRASLSVVLSSAHPMLSEMPPEDSTSQVFRAFKAHLGFGIRLSNSLSLRTQSVSKPSFLQRKTRQTIYIIVMDICSWRSDKLDCWPGREWLFPRQSSGHLSTKTMLRTIGDWRKRPGSRRSRPGRSSLGGRSRPTSSGTAMWSMRSWLAYRCQ